MVFDMRGRKDPRPFEEIREHFRDRCSKPIEFQILVDDFECAKKTSTFSKMSKCRTSIEKRDGHYAVHVKGETCACA